MHTTIHTFIASSLIKYLNIYILSRLIRLDIVKYDSISNYTKKTVMNKLVIMQPTYLPWAGYFNLISQADHFVFLDDVKVEKQSWQVRNKVINDKSEHVISLAIKGPRSQLIQEVLLNDDVTWRKKHSKLLAHNYSKHPHKEVIINTLLPIINDRDITSLCKLNSRIILAISKALNFNPVFHYASELAASGQRSEKLIKICNELECAQYLSPIGSKYYIEQDGLFKDTKIDVRYQHFTPPIYRQQGMSNFIPYLSVIDMIANIGYEKTATLIR